MVPVTRSIQLALPTLSAFVTRLGTAIVPTLRSLAWTFAGVLAVVAVVHLAGITFWPLELLHHFLLIYALLAACLAIAAFTFRMARLAIAASVLMLFFAGAYGRSADFFAGSTAIGLPVSVLTNNVYCGNWDPEGLRNWLATRPADVVALEEVPAHVERALAGLSPDIFPYSARIPAGRTLTRSRWRGCEGIPPPFPLSDRSDEHVSVGSQGVAVADRSPQGARGGRRVARDRPRQRSDPSPGPAAA